MFLKAKYCVKLHEIFYFVYSFLFIFYLLLPPRSNMLMRKPLYFVVSFAKPTVGATVSRDSPTRDFAVHVLPVLSSPNIRMLILRSRTFTEFLPMKWLQHIVPSLMTCIILYQISMLFKILALSYLSQFSTSAWISNEHHSINYCRFFTTKFWT